MTRPSWDEAVCGVAPEARSIGPLTRTDFVRYQGASGDMNPIHHDEPFARAAGFDGPLADRSLSSPGAARSVPLGIPPPASVPPLVLS